MPQPSPTRLAHLQQLSILLEQALQLPASQRAAWLAALPADQQALVPELQALLARSTVDTDTFLQRPLNEVLDADWPEPAASRDLPGQVIGPYRLLRELGAGGMARVWLAERIDGALDRQVALKMPHEGIAQGLRRHMARERGILATLTHPRIARLYDAGATDDGRPWLAMECVDGQPIDAYCREHALDTAQRLELFLQMADAVAYAHTRLVVHRDLKPSNVLVTPEGQVRLLDFGVAKLLQSDELLPEQLTQLFGRPVTPDYASPEQLAGSEVGVATDVYSLGIVLYELLTECRPYQLGRMTAPALARAVCEVQVPLASARCADRPTLARRLRGDLDAILAKALAKLPAERYASVESFAEDVRRHLAGDPVQAQAQTWRYRAGKRLARHKTFVAVSALFLVTLLGGLGAALWQAGVARAEARRAEQVKEFIASVLRQAKPREGQGGVVTARDLLSAASSRIERELAGDPRMAVEIGLIVAESFSSLGEPSRNIELARRTLALAEKHHGSAHPETIKARLWLVESISLQDVPAAEKLIDEAIPAAEAGMPGTALLLSTALHFKSFLLAKREREEESIAALQRGIAVAQEHLGHGHERTISSQGLLANTYGRFGRRAEQLAAAEQAYLQGTQYFGTNRPHELLSAVERWYAEALRNNDRPADAVPILRRVLQDQRALDTAETPRVRNALFQLALALDASGRVEEALPLARQAVAMERAQNPVESDDRAGFLARLADILSGLRRDEEARQLDDEVEAVEARLGQTSQRAVLARQLRRSRAALARGEFELASSLAADVLARTREAQDNFRAEAYLVQASIERLRGRPAQALEAARRVPADPKAERFRTALRAAAAAEEGVALLDLGDWEGGAKALQEAMSLYARAQVSPSPRMATALVGTARVALHAGQAALAESTLQPLLAAWAAVNPDSMGQAETLYWLARAQAALGHSGAAASRKAASERLRQSPLPALRRLAQA